MLKTRKAPMTKDEALDVVKRMRAETPRPAMKRLLQIALGPVGNLGDDARKVYADELKRMS